MSRFWGLFISLYSEKGAICLYIKSLCLLEQSSDCPRIAILIKIFKNNLKIHLKKNIHFLLHSRSWAKPSAVSNELSQTSRAGAHNMLLASWRLHTGRFSTVLEKSLHLTFSSPQTKGSFRAIMCSCARKQFK